MRFIKQNQDFFCGKVCGKCGNPFGKPLHECINSQGFFAVLLSGMRKIPRSVKALQHQLFQQFSASVDVCVDGANGWVSIQSNCKMKRRMRGKEK